MKSFLQSKKGISPVIATVLIVAITIAGVAIVYVLLSDTTDPDQIPVLSYDVESTWDYNNDGLIDLIELKVTNIGSIQTSTTYVLGDNWEILPGYQFTLDQLDEVIIKIGANTTTAQYETGEEVFVGVSHNPNLIATQPVVLPSPTLGDPVSVLYQSGANPIVGAAITFQNDAGFYAQIPPQITDDEGMIETYLLPNHYTAKSGAVESDEFHSVVNSGIVTMGAIAETINIQVVDDGDNPIEGIVVYDADTNQNDLGNSKSTNVEGKVSFTKTTGNYLFRVDYLGTDFWSSQVSIPGSSNANLTIKIDGNAELIGLLSFGETPAGQSKLVRLFTANNASMGKYDYTNSTSHFEFTSGITSGVYRIRMDYQSKQFWSGLISTSDSNLIVDLGGGDLNVIVKGGDDPLPNGVLTRLYNADNSSASRYDYLNGSGVAEYTLTPAGSYRLRVDWLGNRYWTNTFYHSGITQEVNLGGGDLDIRLYAGQGANQVSLPNGVLTRLFNADNSSASRYDYLNASGVAEYGAIPAGSYRLRVDWLGNRFWTSSFEHDGSIVDLNLAGGLLNVQVTAGGQPLPNGVLTRLFNADGSSASRYDYVNGSGVAEYGAIIADGQYKLRIDWLGNRYWTDNFTHDGSLQVLDIGGGVLEVQVTAGDDPLPNGVLTRLFNADGSSASRYDYLGSNGTHTGIAYYGAIPEGTYKLRVDWLGNRYFTDTFDVNGSYIAPLDIGGGVLEVQVTAGGEPLPNGVLTRLFNDDDSSASRYDYLGNNGTHDGVAYYGPIPLGSYKLRIDWLGNRYWTDVFVHNGSSLGTLNIEGGSLVLEITVDGAPLPNGVLTRLFNADDSSASRYDYVNSTGFAEYGVIIGDTFKLRIDWMGERYWTIDFDHTLEQSSYPLDLQGIALLSINVIDDDTNPLPNGQLVRLYHADGTNTGRYTYTNSTGGIEFGAVPAGDYALRWGSDYSVPFTVGDGTQSETTVQIIAGGSLAFNPIGYVGRLTKQN